MRIPGAESERASLRIDAVDGAAASGIARLQRQQAAIAGFGSFALREWDMAKILQEAVRVCAEGLDVPFSKVCRYRADENDLLVVAGHGWRDGVVGHAVSPADMNSPQGRAFCTGKPSIHNDLREDNYFKLPGFYAAHGIISTIDVIIKGVDDRPYGILEIDNNRQHDYDQHDINFLTGFANVLAEAVATASRAAGLQVALDHTQMLVADKDALLRERSAIDQHLRHAQKMEAVGQLTGGVAHDLNNILTVIIGGIEILGEAVVDNPQLASIAGLIDDAAGRGADLTRRLLAFARKQPLHPREIDVNALIVETTGLLQPTLGEHIEIRTTLADDAARALIDAGQLTNAILNLALNARDAMPNGGQLTIATSNIHVDEGHDSASEVAAGDYVLIEVGDSGQGISAAVLERVFEPFFTTKDVGKGTGLGLSMVYGFVKQSLGHITIHSSEGIGTTIRIYLPQATGAVFSPAVMADAADMAGNGEIVLVVEDDALVRTFVLAQIESLGYATLTAANAAEALSVIDGSDDIHILFTDLIMPGQMNGRQLADEALRRRPALKILFTSGYSENAITHNGRLDAGVQLLAKPYRKPDLARMLRSALDSDIKLPPAQQPVASLPDDPVVPPATAA